ncbi:hypothetical protein BH18VER1_BH18VER1_02600 [soil metagenome]
MPASLPTSAGTAGNILLVEDYGALAAAIGSALKQFAPAHRVRVVSTLAAAEGAAAQLQPDLLIVDVDPPLSGIVEFFAKLKFTTPHTRVLIIAAGLCREVVAARTGTVAFEFIDKPFDLLELGRAVEPLLAQSGRSGSILRSLGVSDVLPVLCSSRATTTITVEAAAGRWGEIRLATGQIVHAVAGGRVGKQALQEILSWPAARVAETECKEHAARTIAETWQTVLLEAFAELKAANGKAAKQKQQRPVGKKLKSLVVVDDTELLLVFVEDILSTALPDLQIEVAGSGLGGLKQISASLPDAVLLDYSLPDITGDEVCRRLLENEKTARIPVVMMSGHVPEMTATAVQYENVVATIAKPFLSHALVELVRSTLATLPAIESRRAASEPAQSPPGAASTWQSEAPTPVAEVGDGNRGHGEQDAVPALSAATGVSAQMQGLAAEPQSPPPTGVSERPPEPAPELRAEPELSAIPAPATQSPPSAEPSSPKPITEVTWPEPSLPIPLLISAAGTAAPEPKPTTFPQIARYQPQPEVVAAAAAPVALPAAAYNGVVLGVPLEVLAVQFSPALQMAAIRARPWATTVTLHVQPNALAGMTLPAAGFELAQVELNTRGHIETVRLTPTSAAIAKPPPRDALRVNDLAILPSGGGHAMEMTTTATSPMTMHLFALFELAAVELSQSFGLAALVLRSRGADIRVSLESGGPGMGATFKTAQVLLDREARIAEILLDSVA